MAERLTRRKSKRERQVSDSGETVKRARMEDKLDKVLQELSQNKEDFLQGLKDVTKIVSDGKKEILQRVEAKVDGINTRVKDVENKVNDVGNSVNDLTKRVESLENGYTNGASVNNAQAYWRARRSLRIGPIDADTEQETWEQTRCIFKGELGMSAWEEQCLEIESMGLSVRKMKGGRVFKMAKI